MQANSFENELREVQRGLVSVVEALSFLKEFVEGEYGMRFQFQAFIATKPNHEEISKNLEALRIKYSKQHYSVQNEGHKGQRSSSWETHAATSSETQYHSFYAGGGSGDTSFVADTTFNYQPPTYHFAATNATTTDSESQKLQPNPSGSDNSNQTSFNIDTVTVKADNDDTEDVQYNDDNYEGHDSGSMTDLKDEEFALDPKTGKLKKRKTKTNRRRNAVADKSKWVREVAKIKRMKGEAYTGSILVEREDGKMHSVLAKPRRSRKLGPPCTSKNCEKSSLRHCNIFPENIREMIFNQFWREMDWDQKKAFVAAHSERYCVKRRNVADGSSRRNETYKYYLPINGEKRQVCMNFFCNTVGIRNHMLMNWVRKVVPPPPKDQEPYVPKRRYMKKSERMELNLQKEAQKPGSKCPYCLEIIKRNDFQVHIANHMSQFDTGQSDDD